MGKVCSCLGGCESKHQFIMGRGKIKGVNFAVSVVSYFLSVSRLVVTHAVRTDELIDNQLDGDKLSICILTISESV